MSRATEKQKKSVIRQFQAIDLQVVFIIMFSKKTTGTTDC